MIRVAVFACALLSLVVVPSVADAQDAGKRVEAARSRARFFSKITVKRDYSGEWVVARNRHVTAFIDLMDPRHPRSRGKNSDPNQVHLLVVPNQPREHIAKQMGGRITAADLRAAGIVFLEAKKLARRLGIKDPEIYLNSELRIDVGYLHVHIRGKLSPKKRLPRLVK
ncbi:MAG: hypothetical protein KJO07_07280 [Deltaproteobacteria bacterium]|nr:hypothetical protein [Deltaproteobacteria bacterium]